MEKVSNTQWLTEKQVALLLGISISKLRSDRHKCRGISYHKVGRAVRYSMCDVQAYMYAHRVNPNG